MIQEPKLARATALVALLGLAALTEGCVGCEPPPGPDVRDAALTTDAGAPPQERVSDFLVWGDSLHRWSGDRYVPFFVRGVNLGVGMPGTQPGDLAPQYDDYLRWFHQMKQIGFDVVRVYTLHFPRFHRALRDYNEAHPDDPLYVLQGIWLSEENPSGTRDLHGLNADFTALIEETIDAAHGDAVIAERRGRAWGAFDVDISRWVLGYIVGREIYSQEVLATDRAHPEETTYEGRQLRLAHGNPSSVWAAARLDHALTHEWERHGRRTPMAFANWMELDPLHHPTEPSRTGKDVATIDLVEVEPFGAPQGVFFSYHVYPYYPRFISDQPSYQRYEDELGNNSYRGYLTELKTHHRGRALMVTEYGVPSSWGVAQLSSSGMHQGGHTEREQGTYNARMLRDIHAVGCAGAVYFHWMDGWFKRIWLHEPRTFPAERLRLWNDLMNPQQGYGLVAFDAPAPTYALDGATTGSGRVREVRADADALFFHVRVALSSPLEVGEPMIVAYDTYRDDLGESRLPGGARSPRRVELALVVGGGIEQGGAERARLSVMASYDLYGILGARGALPSRRRSTPSDSGEWRPVVYNTVGERVSDDGVHRFPAEDWEAGLLRVRRPGTAPSSHDAVVVEGNVVTIRVPWTLLQLADPTALRALHDDVDTPDVVETEETEGLAVVVALGDEVVSTDRFRWARWDRAPVTVERLKESVAPLAEALARIPGLPTVSE